MISVANSRESSFSESTTWTDLYMSYDQRSQVLPQPAPVPAPKAAVPNEFVRYNILTQHFITYYRRDKSIYFLRVFFYGEAFSYSSTILASLTHLHSHPGRVLGLPIPAIGQNHG
jgi:hypothetical protein